MKKLKLLMLCMDGLMPSRVLKAAESGKLPAISGLMNRGALIRDILPVFPTITPVCWAGLVTGAYPSRNNVTCSDVHFPGQAAGEYTPAYLLPDYDAENIWDVLSKEGKKVFIASIPSCTMDIYKPPADPNLFIMKSSAAEPVENGWFTLESGLFEFTACGGLVQCSLDIGIREGNIFVNERKIIEGEPSVFDFCGRKILLTAETAGCGKINLGYAVIRDKCDFFYPRSFAELCGEAAGELYAADRLRRPFKSLEDLPGLVRSIRRHFKLLLDSAAAALEQGADAAILYHQVFDDCNHRFQNIWEGFAQDDCFSRREIEAVYDTLLIELDEYIRGALDMTDEDTVVLLVSDHGAAGYKKNRSPADILLERGLMFYEGDGKSVDSSRSKAFPIGTCHVFVNLKGRERYGIVDESDYPDVCEEIIDALRSGYRDESTGHNSLAFALTNRESRFLGLGGPLCGDVVYGLRGVDYSRGVHGSQIPSLETGTGGSLGCIALLCGPGVKMGYTSCKTYRLWDIVPTICRLKGYPIPNHCQGAIIYDALT